MARMGGQSYAISMNELSNHDHSRFLTRTNHVVGRVAELGPEAANKNVNKAVFMEAVVIQMTWPGAPTIYYGDEAGVCGFTDPDTEEHILGDMRIRNLSRSIRMLLKCIKRMKCLEQVRISSFIQHTMLLHMEDFPWMMQ